MVRARGVSHKDYPQTRRNILFLITFGEHSAPGAAAHSLFRKSAPRIRPRQNGHPPRGVPYP